MFEFTLNPNTISNPNTLKFMVEMLRSISAHRKSKTVLNMHILLSFFLSVSTFLLLLSVPWGERANSCKMLAACREPKFNMPAIPNLGAYYQTSLSHISATETVLQLFRRVYPSAPVFIYIDNDHDKGIQWEAYNPVIVTIRGKKRQWQNFVTTGNFISTVGDGMNYIKRIISAAQGLDWLILLEDDVWVCNSINVSSLGTHAMSGRCTTQFDSKRWAHLLPGPCYGGCGGYVLKGSFLQSVMKVDRGYIHAIFKQIKRPIASDELLSAVLYKSNGTIGTTKDFAEEMSEHPVIIHQMKAFYHGDAKC